MNHSQDPVTQNRRRLFLVLPALLLPLLASFFYFVLFPGTQFGNSFYTGIKVFLLLWPIIVVAGILREPLIDRSLQRDHKGSLLWGTLFGLATAGLMLFLMLKTPMRDVVFDNTDQIAGRIADLGVAESFLLFAGFLCIIHSGLEEFFWRWFAFGQLQKALSKPLAHGIAALGFSSHHIVILSQFVELPWAIAFGLCVGVGGAVWSKLFDRSKSILGPWWSHLIVDVAIMWVGWEVLQTAA